MERMVANYTALYEKLLHGSRAAIAARTPEFSRNSIQLKDAATRMPTASATT